MHSNQTLQFHIIMPFKNKIYFTIVCDNKMLQNLIKNHKKDILSQYALVKYKNIIQS